jgi:two-component system, OmpR family, copper resistance phosphate regulon response regulator CusR
MPSPVSQFGTAPPKDKRFFIGGTVHTPAAVCENEAGRSVMARVLVVEDERKVLLGLQRGLEREGYEAVVAATGEEGLRHALSGEFDCVVLDVLLPGRNGLEVLAEMRRQGRQFPVLLLTARDAIEDRVAGLDAGADDYLVKPFAFPELLARLRALLHAADLDLDLIGRIARRAGEEIVLTHREFEVLTYLARHKNAVVTRAMLGRDVWKDPDVSLTNVIDVYINLLRRKLEGSGQGQLIHTVRGVGYVLQERPCD